MPGVIRGYHQQKPRMYTWIRNDVFEQKGPSWTLMTFCHNNVWMFFLFHGYFKLMYNWINSKTCLTESAVLANCSFEDSADGSTESINYRPPELSDLKGVSEDDRNKFKVAIKAIQKCSSDIDALMELVSMFGLLWCLNYILLLDPFCLVFRCWMFLFPVFAILISQYSFSTFRVRYYNICAITSNSIIKVCSNSGVYYCWLYICDDKCLYKGNMLIYIKKIKHLELSTFWLSAIQFYLEFRPYANYLYRKSDHIYFSQSCLFSNTACY